MKSELFESINSHIKRGKMWKFYLAETKKKRVARAAEIKGQIDISNLEYICVIP